MVRSSNKVVFFLSSAVIMVLIGCATSNNQVRAQNTEVINLVFSEIWSKGKIDLIEKLYADDYVGHFPEATVHGRNELRTIVVAHRTSFPDWTEEIEETISEHDQVVVRFTSRGTNLGSFHGNPPTGNRVEISEVAIFRLRDGEIVEQWVYPDVLSLQRQLSNQ